jgi:ABC-2 type transport system permease protein
VHWTVARVAVLGASIVSGAVIFASVWVLGACLTFFTVGSGEVANAFTYGGNMFASYPLDVFGVWFRRFLAFVIPLGFVAYEPAVFILGKPDALRLVSWLRGAEPVVALAIAAVAGFAWRFSVAHYRSTGS